MTALPSLDDYDNNPHRWRSRFDPYIDRIEAEIRSTGAYRVGQTYKSKGAVEPVITQISVLSEKDKIALREAWERDDAELQERWRVNREREEEKRRNQERMASTQNPSYKASAFVGKVEQNANEFISMAVKNNDKPNEEFFRAIKDKTISRKDAVAAMTKIYEQQDA